MIAVFPKMPFGKICMRLPLKIYFVVSYAFSLATMEIPLWILISAQYKGKNEKTFPRLPLLAFSNFYENSACTAVRIKCACITVCVCILYAMCNGLLLQSLVILCTHSYTNINALKLHVQSFSQSPVLSRFPSLFPAHTSKLTEALSRSRTANFCQITQTSLTRRFCASAGVYINTFRVFRLNPSTLMSTTNPTICK